MKILRIKFQNLNSLPTGDIDLEPFSQAGIFAITGPTGSGKSTILDAITLALYGRAARYDKQSNPSDMMSRHTGASQAEVLFEVKGVRYRAEWQLKRSRGRSNGKMQPPLHRLYDAQEQPIAQNHTETVREVEEITGLNHDRFLRSVLLAQGQFAQFLKASENQRAELLESLTGTSVYSELSILAHQETSQREHSLKEKEAVLGNVTLLSDEARQEKGDAIGCLDAELSKLRQAQESVATQLHRGQQLATLRHSSETLTARQSALATEREQAAPQLQRLASHREGEVYHPALITLDHQRQQATHEAKQRDETQAELRKSGIALLSATEASRTVARTILNAASTALEAAHQEKTAQQTALEPLTRWLAEQTADAALEPILPELAGSLNTLSHTRNALAKCVHDVAKLLSEKEALAPDPLQQQVKEAATTITTTAAKLQKAEAAVQTLLQGKTTQELFTSAATLEKKTTALLKLEGAMQKQEVATKEGSTLATREAELQDDLKGFEEQKKATESEAETQRNLLDLARKNLSLLERIAGYETQRALLSEGSPCPLCGALSHPFAHSSAEVLAEIDAAKRNVATAEAANSTAAKEVQLATEHLARTKEGLRQILQRRGELRREQTQDHDQFSELAQRLRVYTLEGLEEATAANHRARAELEKRLTALRAAETDLSESKVEHTKAVGETTRAQEALTARLTALENLQARLQTIQTTGESLTGDLQAIEQSVAASLAPYSVALPPAGEETATRKALETRTRLYQTNLREEAALRALIAQTTHKIETLTQRRADLATQAAALLHGTPQEADLATLPPDAAQITRLSRQWITLEETAAALEGLRIRFTQCRAAHAERRNRYQEANATLTRLHESLLQQLAATPFGTLEAYRASRLSPAELAEIEAVKSRFEDEAHRIASQLEQLREQIATLSDAPQGDALVALEEERKKTGTALLETADQRTRLVKELEDDETRRRSHETLAEALEAERGRLATWQQLDNLIGSASGAKFSRFAQGLSLEILMRHANRHLGRLSDRYQLQRSPEGELVMEIVDLHQANATRPMQSLSGGESFLVSLALALGLSDLAGRNVRIDSLFIDEGFGSLDADTLDLAVSALDSLRLSHKTVGVISHIDLLKERIPMQIRVVKQPGGISRLILPNGAQ